MRLVNIDNIVPGMRLGEPLHGVAGQLLLQRGVRLDSRFISHLRQMGIPAVYIQEDDTSDIALPHAVLPETRAKVLSSLVHAFEAVAHHSDSFRETSQKLARQHIRSERLAKPLGSIASDAGLGELLRGVDELIDQAMGNEVLAGLNSIKTYDDYTFQHSIDVTIMALVLAKKAGWDKQRLKTFGIGCILHDIGKIFIDREILNKPGPLTAEEFVIMKAHPVVGHEVILAIAPGLGYLVPQVAYQHHERQDGSGYPCGRKGGEALGDHSGGLIHEFGALSAVADVYDALTSHRSYRPGWAPERAANFVASCAGTHFNRQAVDLFTSAVAPFPVCSDVRVCNGRCAGFIGIVASVSAADLKRPKVRLLFDAFGQRIAPIEIDLLVEADVTIAPLVMQEVKQLARLSA